MKIMVKKTRCLSGVLIHEVKRVSKIIFGDNLHKVELNTDEMKYDIYVWGSEVIDEKMEERFYEQIQHCRIIPIQKIGKPNTDKIRNK